MSNPQPRSSWMLARLEQETHDHHAAADADRFSVLDDPTVAGYRRFLATVYQFEYSVESKLVYVVELSLRHVRASLGTGLLIADLQALGFDYATKSILAHPIQRPRFAAVEEAVGWMYVIQRNSLQHGALYRALVPRLRGTMKLASRYLTAHTNHVYERWQELGALIDAAATTPERANAIVAAAHDAFRRQHDWFVTARAPALSPQASDVVARAW